MRSVLNILGRAIVRGDYPEGVLPTEAQFAARYLVSRTVIREAIKMLTAKGLLSARPRQGTIVEPENSWDLFDPDVLNWLMEGRLSIVMLRQFGALRVAIEPAASKLAAARATNAELDEIRSACRVLANAATGSRDAFEGRIAFHSAIIQSSGNPFYARCRSVVETSLRASNRFSGDCVEDSGTLFAYESVSEATLARNGEAAYAAMRVIVQRCLHNDEKAHRMRAARQQLPP